MSFFIKGNLLKVNFKILSERLNRKSDIFSYKIDTSSFISLKYGSSGFNNEKFILSFVGNKFVFIFILF